MTGEDAVRILAGRPGAVLHETHGSWVVAIGDRAIKVKKPVRFAFLDYSTPALRRAACAEEVRVNAGLAPGIYLGVRGLLGVGDDVAMTDAADPGAVDYAVEMRRFDQSATMASRIGAGTLTSEDVAATGARLASFHAAAAACRRGAGAAVFAERVDADLADLAAFVPATSVDELRAFAAGFLARRGGELDARARRGTHRDGHGDLRADHVLLDHGTIRIIDRIEFDPRLRCVDVADDLAFLCMDLESRGARWAANALIDAYRAAGGDPGDRHLLAGFAWRRALVRAKVAGLREDTATMARKLELADVLAWRARGPVTIAVCGPPASGKTTLAAALAARLELHHVSSDVVRKGLAGVPSHQPAPAWAYAAEATERTYGELRDIAAGHAAQDGGVVIDATFRSRKLRAEIAGALDVARWIVLEAPEEVLRNRAGRRTAEGGSASDADASVAAELRAAFEPLEELPAGRVVTLDATREPGTLARQVAAALDAPADP